ncbi:MAG TPA: thiosulfate oxidation carrier complex protein SoxZ [Spirochaetes bacterium]|nr:thiosulfate oxidation carrier complex protein SoxZ [Spirochaetota bacterium]
MAAIGKSIISTKTRGDLVYLRTILIHPQNTGRVKDKRTKKLIPELYVNRITVKNGGKLVTTMNAGAALSQNPYIELTLAASKASKIQVTWRDTSGRSWNNSKSV